MRHNKKKARKSILKYKASRKSLSSRQFFHKRIFKKVTRVLFTLLSASLFFFLFFIFFLTSTFQIKEWKIEVIRENIYISSEEISQHIKNSLKRNKYSSNIFLFSEKVASDDVLNNFPEIARIEIKKIPPDSLRIYVHDRYLSFIFIGPQEGRYFVDAEGVVVHSRDKEPYLEVYSDFITEKPSFRDRVFSRDEVDEIAGIVRNFQNNFGIKVKKVGFLSAKNEVHLHTEKKTKIMLERDKINQGLETLKGGLQKINLEKGNLEYVDLRIPSKIFVL